MTIRISKSLILLLTMTSLAAEAAVSLQARPAQAADMTTIRDYMRFKLTEMFEAGRISGPVEEEIEKRIQHLNGLEDISVDAFLVRKSGTNEVVGFGSYVVTDDSAEIQSWLCTNMEPSSALPLFDAMEISAAQRGVAAIKLAMLSDHPGIGFLKRRGYELSGSDTTDPDREVYSKSLA